MSLAPIVLFTYARPLHTERTIRALRSARLASDSHLIIFSDGPKNPKDIPKVDAVRSILKNINGFSRVDIQLSHVNLGLSRSIIKGVEEVVYTYGKVIVLEDDLVVSKCFLEYMNHYLKVFENNLQVISIHGYIYPVLEALPDNFFLKGADCWGWATWKRGWDMFNPDASMLISEIKGKKLQYEFDFYGSYPYTDMLQKQYDGDIDSWAIRWYASAFLNNKLTLYPGRSMVTNIGNDASGTHSQMSENFNVILSNNLTEMILTDVNENLLAKRIVSNYFKSIYKYYRFKRFIHYSERLIKSLNLKKLFYR